MTTDGLHRLRLGVAAIALTGLGAGAGAMTLATPEPTAPKAPMALEALPAPDLSAIDDGFGHHLVRVVADDATPAGSAADMPAGSADPVPADPPSTADPGERPAIAVDDLASIGDEIDHLDGDGATTLVAVLTDGTRVPVLTDAVRQEPTPTPDQAAHGIHGLRTLPSTRAVEEIGGGWYSVTTELGDEDFADRVDELGLAATKDVPAVISSDDEHSELLWGLDNPGGVSFGGVIGVTDVDIDGVEARRAERGDGVIVAVIDSGAVPDHPDLPEFWINVDEDCTNGIDDDANGFVDDCHGWDFFNDDNSPADAGVDNSHGTHVTGTIAAVPDNGVGVAGLAPGVTIMNLKALQNGSTWTSKLARAIYYAVDNGASVINASFGSTGATMAQLPGLTSAVEYAQAHGVIIVAAAGNSGADIGTSPTFPAAFPHDNVITVGADTANGQPAGFSNRGDEEVDLHAPGHYIVSTVPGGYSAKQGTSMAAPHVTAAVALLQAADPGADVSAIRAGLLETVDRRPSLTGTSVSGGSLNAARALGADAPDEAAPLEVRVHGLDGLRAGRTTSLRVVSTVRDSAIAGDRPVVVRATVLTVVDGVDYGLVGLPVSVDGTATETDDHAQFILSEHQRAYANLLLSGHGSTVTTTFDAGVHALVVEIVDAQDPDAAYGPAAVTFFEVPPAPEDDPTPDPDDDPDTVNDPDVPVDEPDDPVGDDPEPTDPSEPTDPVVDGDPAPDAPSPTPTTVPGGDTPPATPEGPGAPTTPAPGDPGGSPTPTVPGTPTPTPTTAPSEPAPSTPVEPTPTDPGIQPPPTTAPDAPLPTTPPTTTPVPVPPSTPPPVTVPEDPAPVSRAGMTLRKLSPTWGRPEGGNIVVIHGRNLPEAPLVFVGGVPATVKRANDASLIIEMPPALPGVYDVTVVDEDGFAVTLRLAYTYAPKRPRPGTPVTPGPTIPLPELPGGANPDLPVGDDPGVGDPTTPDIGDPGGEDPAGEIPDQPVDEIPAPTTPPSLPTPTGRPRLELAADPSEHHEGRAHRVVVGSPIDLPPSEWASRTCGRHVCGAELHSWLPGA